MHLRDRMPHKDEDWDKLSEGRWVCLEEEVDQGVARASKCH